jgi:hypothetical protein
MGTTYFNRTHGKIKILVLKNIYGRTGNTQKREKEAKERNKEVVSS